MLPFLPKKSKIQDIKYRQPVVFQKSKEIDPTNRSRDNLFRRKGELCH